MAKPITNLSDAIRAYNKDGQNVDARNYIKTAFAGRSGIFVEDSGKISLDQTLEAFDALEDTKARSLVGAVSFDDFLAQSRPVRDADPVVCRALFGGKTVDANPAIDWSQVSVGGRKAAAFAAETRLIPQTDDSARLAAYYFAQPNPPPPYSTAIDGYQGLVAKKRPTGDDRALMARVESRLVFDPSDKSSADPALQKLLAMSLPKAPEISVNDPRLQPGGGNFTLVYLQVQDWAPLLSREQCVAVAMYLVGPGCQPPDSIHHPVRSAQANALWRIVGDAGNGPQPKQRFQDLLAALK